VALYTLHTLTARQWAKHLPAASRAACSLLSLSLSPLTDPYPGYGTATHLEVLHQRGRHHRQRRLSRGRRRRGGAVGGISRLLLLRCLLCDLDGGGGGTCGLVRVQHDGCVATVTRPPGGGEAAGGGGTRGGGTRHAAEEEAHGQRATPLGVFPPRPQSAAVVYRPITLEGGGDGRSVNVRLRKVAGRLLAAHAPSACTLEQ
jgi:hypothetical protein